MAHLVFRSQSDDHVEAGREFTGFRSRDRLEIADEKFAKIFRGTIQDAVFGIKLVAFDVSLCREDALPFYADGDMNVRRASSVGSRLDAAEIVFTG